jgi:hypothetical protein
MYEPLFARLAGQFHLIAPDYPGFGHSDAPDPKTFAYTFDHIAEVIEDFTDVIGATHIGSSPNIANYDPDLWTDEFTFLSRPGETEIQTDLFHDYRTNETRFTDWQAWMRRC